MECWNAGSGAVGHHSIIPFPGQIRRPQKPSILPVCCRNSETFNYSLAFFLPAVHFITTGGLGSNIGHGLFVGWVEHPDIFCWISFLNPTYLPAIFVLSAKPNKMAEDRTIPPLANSHELVVKEGTVYFSVSETSRLLDFNTPAGNAAMGQVSLSNLIKTNHLPG